MNKLKFYGTIHHAGFLDGLLFVINAIEKKFDFGHLGNL